MWNLESDKPVVLNLSQIEGRKQIFELGRFTRSWRLCPFAPPKKAASLTMLTTFMQVHPEQKLPRRWPKVCPRRFWNFLDLHEALLHALANGRTGKRILSSQVGRVWGRRHKSSMWRHFFSATFMCKIWMPIILILAMTRVLLGFLTTRYIYEFDDVVIIITITSTTITISI